MFDNYNRKINYLRISVTDRCNLRCIYCMPQDGIKQLDHSDIITFEEIEEVVKTGVGLGIDKVRITGGEPLVRKGIVDLVRKISKIPGIKDFGLTTNGILLSGFAKDLKDAGLHRINISLDTLNPDRFRSITRKGILNDVLEGIKAAEKVALRPIKINCVVKESSLEPDALEILSFCKANSYKVRFIHQMDLVNGHFSVVEGGEGGNCEICNRIRLTANGKIKPCLFNNIEYDIRELGIETAMKKAVEEKPACGSVNQINEFYNIGG